MKINPNSDRRLKVSKEYLSECQIDNKLNGLKLLGLQNTILVPRAYQWRDKLHVRAPPQDRAWANSIMVNRREGLETH